jgi:hypothetical protein
MEEFFKSELRTLKAKTGLNQYENLSAMADAQFQFHILISSMILACDEFPYIGENDKKRIIQEQILRDQDFTGLNSRVIWKWLNANKDHYWAVAQAKADPVQSTPVAFNKLPVALQEQINAFKISLMERGPKSVPQNVQEDMKKIKQEDEGRVEKVSYSKGYVPPTEEEILKRDLHLEYVRQNFDAISGKKKENWMPEEQWLELQK